MYRQQVLGDVYLDKPKPTDLEDQIKAKFGDPNEMSKKYNDNFATIKVVNLLTKTPETKDMGTISNIKELVAVLDYYRKQNVKTLRDEIAGLKENANKDDNKTSEKICNDVGDKNETGCNKTPGCHFVASNGEGKKCTLSEEGKKTVQKEAEKETGGKDGKDRKKEEKCAKHGTDKNACDKDNN
ncbi:uncharacterized protein TEOVI_000282400 [Trypanosoma equiperdum]|uniref:Trypanosome variant surface glycoprotein A-type N-terminal domain-containing protein n=1 Tax=Trypanosoma equiperdum TaxID=5694 RepID=A0A1G4IFS7_TRYEQ|nr:hypothetical protein TEOVI_000282400 [Trypanosoma equiperdum]